MILMIFLGLFIFFVCMFAYLRHKSTAAEEAAAESFWNRENEANHTRRKDISGLPYITIPLEKFPIGISDDEELTDYENDLKTLASRKILNLSHQSNTDLKLAYGPANLPALSEYDQNYTTLLRNLVAYADCLIKNGFEAEAVPVLEFGISIDSDIRANYTLLAGLYREQGNTAKIQKLIDKAASLDSMMRSAILDQLHTIQNS
jgi:tetratricopeptide (TPR) repeat protein